MSILKPVPLIPKIARNVCPICGKDSYSRGGIHPQCAVQQADEPRNQRLKLERKKKAQLERPRKRRWNTRLPKLQGPGASSTWPRLNLDTISMIDDSDAPKLIKFVGLGD